MSANGQLVFTDVDKVTFKGVGNASNAVIDTTTGKIGVGVDSPDANLHVVGNCFVSTNFELGGTMTMGTVTVEAQHELSAITATGNLTPHTIQFTNPTTAFTTTGNVEVGKELTVTGNVAVDTDTLFVDTVNDRVGVGKTDPATALDVDGTVTATAFTGDGSGLTALNATNIASGTLDAARIPTLNQSTTGSAATLTTPRSIGGVDFDGSAAIVLPGVDAVGTQNTSGSAATLTTPRSIGGVDFDGSVAIVPTTFGAATFSGDVTVDSSTFHVDTTENRVGVGTDAPAYTLDVHGSANVGVITTTDINVTGNLAVLGTSTIVDTDNLRVKDPIIELGKDNTASPIVDLGLILTRPTGNSNVAIIFDESTDKLEIGYTQGNASQASIAVETAAANPISVNVNGTVTATAFAGNASTATKLAASVNIGGVAFDGSGDITPTTFDGATFNGHLNVTGNTFYTNPMSISVDSNVVAEYTGPHDRPLRKYPEVTLTSAAQTGSGYEGYIVTRSSDAGGTFLAWKVFNNKNDLPTEDYPWISQNTPDGYTPATGLPTGANGDVFQGVDGAWLSIELPHNIKLSYMMLSNRNDTTVRPPKDIVVWGSLDGTTWTSLKTYTNMNVTQAAKYTVDINSTTVYKYFRLHVLTMHIGQFSDAVAIGEWELYGHEEGDSSLDTTLKSVYNVPGTQQLEVYYDAKDLEDGAVTNVTDLSGNGVTGAGSGDLAVSNGAFTFDGTGDEISGTLPSSANGDWVHSLSMWFKADSVNSANDGNTLFYTSGSISANNILFLRMYGGENPYIRYSDIGSEVKKFMNILTGVWYHLTLTYSGGGWANAKMYINGELTNDVTSTDTTPLTLTGSSTFYIARAINSFNPSFNGSIANFRLFSKVLNADQIKELYDYQKDYFLGTRSSVTLYKGHLGIGVAEPSGQLELAGDERLQEYPPGPMGRYDYETLIPGHGVFCAYASVDSSPTYSPGAVFDKTANIFYWEPLSGGARYSTSSPGNYLKSNRLAAETALGEYLVLKLPYKIKLDSFSIARQNDGWWTPQEIIYYAKSEEEDLWEQIHSHGSIMGSYANGLASSDGTNDPIHREVKSTKFYRYFALVITKANGGAGTSLNEWRLFGTPGPTTLDKGSLTLGRSLDVPRISRYDVDTETPRPEKLVLDFDTTVNSSPTDISGQGNHGVFYNGASYSAADKAFSYDGTDDYIETSSVGFTGDQLHTASLWFWSDKAQTAMGTNEHGLYSTGDGSGGGRTGGRGGLSCYSPTTNKGFRFWKSGEGGTNFGSVTFAQNTWNHVILVYPGGGHSSARLWLNGVERVAVSSDGADGNYNFIASDDVIIGDWYNTDGTARGDYPWDGKISNFKLYNVALEASEVQKLYRLGRTGRSMVISDTAVGIGKVPEAQLDVRGTLNVDGDIFLNGFKIFQPITPIARDGLAVLLDASDLNSYTTSGNSFYDTSGNGRHGTLQGSVGWTSSGQQSYFDFPGANADYIYQTSGSAFKFKDICIVFKFDDVGVGSWNYLISYGVTPDDSIRNYQGITYNGISGGDWAYPATTYYLNGVATTGNLTMAANKWYILGGAATNTDFIDNVHNYYLGTGGTTWNRNLDGKIAFVALYNRVLSAEEQLQNYTALKKRFGV